MNIDISKIPWENISILLNILFFTGNIAQIIYLIKEKNFHKGQVQIWQHFAQGISYSLMHLANCLRENKIDNLKPKEFGEIIFAL